MTSILSQSIKEFYEHASDNEVTLAQGNLLGFFKTLERIELRIQSESKLKHTQKGKEKTNENFRGTN